MTLSMRVAQLGLRGLQTPGEFVKLDMATVIGCPKIEIPPFAGFAEGLTVEADDCPEPDLCELPHATTPRAHAKRPSIHHGRLRIDHRLSLR
jgi:hypothetical protein